MLPWSVAATNFVLKIPPLAAICGATLVVLHDKHWAYFVGFGALAYFTNANFSYMKKQ